MTEWLMAIGLIVLIISASVVITKATKKFCEDDFNPDNWKK
jgi:hypothetical protein